MARREQFLMTESERRARRFSEGFKRAKVKEIESGKSKVSEISKEYEVTTTNVYRWLRKFGTNKDKPERIIVEHQSDTKQLIELRKRVAELEQIIGQKQILLDFSEKMIDLAEEYYQIDIKKKFTGTQSNTIGKTEKS